MFERFDIGSDAGESIAAGAAFEVRAERAAQARQLRVEGARGVGGRVGGPQGVDEGRGGDGAAGFEREPGQEGALAAGGNRDLGPRLVAHPQRSQQLHSHAVHLAALGKRRWTRSGSGHRRDS